MSAYRWPERLPWEYGQSTSWATNGSMLNAQQSNAMAHFDIGKLTELTSVAIGTPYNFLTADSDTRARDFADGRELKANYSSSGPMGG
jgi:hypothetical protein